MEYTKEMDDLFMNTVELANANTKSLNAASAVFKDIFLKINNINERDKGFMESSLAAITALQKEIRGIFDLEIKLSKVLTCLIHDYSHYRSSISDETPQEIETRIAQCAGIQGTVESHLKIV